MSTATSTVPLTERRWYRIAHWSLALSALLGCIYFYATFRGWLPGDSGRRSTLLLLGSSTAGLWALLALRRMDRVALGLQLLSATLLIWSILSFGRGN